jgi:hypothetical protein
VINKRDYKGVQITEIYKCRYPIEATVAFSGKRLVFKGNFTIDITGGSWKFGNQIQFVMWTKNNILQEERAINDGYNRIEIALPINEIHDIKKYIELTEKEIDIKEKFIAEVESWTWDNLHD